MVSVAIEEAVAVENASRSLSWLCVEMNPASYSLVEVQSCCDNLTLTSPAGYEQSL